MKNLITTLMFFLIASYAIAQGSLDSALVAYYPFNGNSNDETGNGHNGTVNGGILTYDRFNQQDNAYTFPNLHNNIVLDNTIGMNLETGFTLNAWVKYKNINCGIVGKHNCWVINGFYFGISSNQIYLRVGNSTWSEVITNETFIEDKWYMVTGVFDSSSSTIKIYVDGMLKISGAGTYNNFSSASMTISEASNGCPNGNMPGAIDEVKIYNRALSDAEILEEYNLSNTDLIAYYPFNGNANDESGNNINPSYIGSGVTLTSDRFGLNNRAFYFDGNAGSYIRFPADSLPTTSRTISLWMNAYDLSTGRVPFSYGGSGACNTSSFLMAVNNQGNSSFWSAGHCAQSVISYVYSAPPINTWKHWVITIEGSTQRLYIDGELKESTTNYSGSAYVEGRSAIIGGLIYIDGNTIYVDPSAGYFKGKIDDIRIYNHAVTDQQVIELYNDSTTYTPPTLEDGLALFLPFNGNANDESGNNLNLTNSGALLTADRFGVQNRAYKFNGTSKLYCADNDLLDLTGDFSVSFWISHPASILYKFVLSKHYSGVDNDGSWGIASYIDNTLTFTATPFWGFASPNPTSANIPVNEWHQIAFTYQKNSGLWKAFKDGTLTNTNTQLFNVANTDKEFIVGACMPDEYKIDASLDDIRIYNRVLTDQEVVMLYNDSTTYFPAFIDSVYPYQNSNYLTAGENIKVFFSQPMIESTFNYNSISTHGNLTGSYELIFTYQSSTNTLEIQPTVPFKYGEQITVMLDSSIQSVSGYNLLPYIFQFNVKPEKGSVKFAVADSFQLNFPPINIVSGDFNNDGKVDVIVSNYDSSKYTILLNNGTGGFTLGEELAGPFKPYSISFTDIDNDRDLDMIVSTNEENKIRVLRGTGQGIFSWILPYIDVNAPIATCPGDFDGDGDNDFVALCNTGNAIFYKNDGTGVFTPSGTNTISVPSTIRNIVGDIDNDGDLDIIGGTSDYSGLFKILENDGNGNFTFTGGPYLGPYPDELAGGDFDGDYDLDFIRCDWYQSGLGIGLNNGLGEFPIQNFLNLGNVGGTPRNPIVNDFDGDGDMDAINTNGNSIQMLSNKGTLNFTLENSYPIESLKGLAAADFDNNGSIDLVGINNTTNQIKFLKNCVDSLVAYYPFNGNANDISGNINNGVIYNATLEMDRYGTPNSALFFAGDGYVEGTNPGNNLPAGNSPRSFTAWVNIGNNNPSGSNIFHYGTTESAPTNFHFLVTNPAGLGNGYGYGVVYGITNVADGFWHFVSGVYEGGTERLTKIYVDGKPDGSGAITTEPNTILNSKWSIGKFMAGFSSFSGYVDEIKVYNEVLSDEEIWNLYTVTTTAPNLISPSNNSTINTLIPILQWDSLITAYNYRLELASDSTFASTLISEVVPQKSYQIQNGVLSSNNNYYWRVKTATDGGVGPWSEIYKFRVVITGIEDETQIPTEFALLQNYPNPFNPSTTITYHLPDASNVELKIYNALGKEIATLVNEFKPAGIYNIQFLMSNLSSGIYFYQLKAGDYLETKKMILIK